MSKSIPLTNEMRGNIADALTLQAIAKHAPKLAARLEKLNSQFWEKHCGRVDSLLKLDRARWPELIQAGMINPVSQVDPEYRDERDKYHALLLDRHGSILNLMARTPAFSKVFRFLTHRRYHAARGDRVLRFVCDGGSAPFIRGMDELDPSKPLFRDIKKLEADLQEVVAAGASFRDQVITVLYACKTSRQLEELLPEAAKLVPQPPAESKSMVPAEMAQSVRQMLAKGVPPVQAAQG